MWINPGFNVMLIWRKLLDVFQAVSSADYYWLNIHNPTNLICDSYLTCSGKWRDVDNTITYDFSFMSGQSAFAWGLADPELCVSYNNDPGGKDGERLKFKTCADSYMLVCEYACPPIGM